MPSSRFSPNYIPTPSLVFDSSIRYGRNLPADPDITLVLHVDPRLPDSIFPVKVFATAAVDGSTLPEYTEVGEITSRDSPSLTFKSPVPLAHFWNNLYAHADLSAPINSTTSISAFCYACVGG